MTDDSLEIPASARKAIYERDGGICRMCGIFCGPGWYDVHHIIFGGDQRGVGGRRIHNVDEMVSLCRTCHSKAHARKLHWQPMLSLVVKRPGITAFQLARWQRAAQRRR